ncbi:TPA: hypothetical protein F3L06_19595 [Aeromonas hydrophila]|nr:hypothetical protein [Aeromonas hydrophila]
MPFIDVDSLGGLPEGSLLALSNAELAAMLREAVKGADGIGEELMAMIEEAAQRLIETGE